MSVIFYHNPRCRTSRNALALLERQGVEPKVIEYLKTPYSTAELKRLLKLLGMTPKELLRPKEAKEAGLTKPGLSDAAIIAGMAKNPITVERPIVVNGNKAALGRPAEKVLEVL
jgi:arsenate reductase (glutaredoxin)